ncbi:hypothetical protein [[Clostridium] aminophilum]|uniref:Uncharacterized protein n=1 Tax=[Clostridium] aminophilum TaxID=1526 RepID=A0A1I6IS67_9FIRM|nr:hypothetical protein [[Clostridium] aminophilum]SFR69481.1 hypothetical protein SAMN02910262_00713 [[Clostridium] aminophilum]
MPDISSLSRYGKIGSYTKQFKMQQKWEQKKTSGNVLSKQSSSVTEPQKEYKSAAGMALAEKQANDQLLLDQFSEQQANRDEKMEAITNKVMYGNDLTPEEMDYIKEKNPALYRQLMEEEAEAKLVEEKLKHAETKEEAREVIWNETAKAMSVAKTTSSDPHISEADKLAILGKQLRKVKNAAEKMQEFQESGAYEKLPTEVEKDIAERDEKEAKEYEMEEALKSITEKMEEIQDRMSPSEEEAVSEPENAGASENAEIAENIESAENSAATANSKPAANPKVAVNSEIPESAMKPENRKNMTLNEAQNTYEAQKLRRSRHKKEETLELKTENRGADPVPLQKGSSAGASGGISGLFGMGGAVGSKTSTGGSSSRSLDVKA